MKSQVFNHIYSLYQIIQLVFFYQNISSEDFKSLVDVAWEKENPKVLQVDYKWTNIYKKSQCLKAHLQLALDRESVFNKSI